MNELIILEDAPVRLDQFQLQLAHVKFAITDSVKEFLELVEEAEAAGTLKLLIMDHDLGHPQYEGGRTLNYDKDGLSGTEAAKMLQTTVPVIVWSANREGAGRMVHTLKAKGLDAAWLPIWQMSDIANNLRNFFPAP